MSERPILFSGPMVRAILDGRKTQTRRVVKWPVKNGGRLLGSSGVYNESERPIILTGCPYGTPGDRLWVRETWAIKRTNLENYGSCYPGPASNAWLDDGKCLQWGMKIEHRATTDWDPSKTEYMDGKLGCWRPPIHMPRWASRLTLEVAGVRVERVQDISEDDATSEGAPWLSEDGLSLHAKKSRKFGFANLWDSINGKRPGCSWTDNPWVWAVEFKVVTQ